MSQSLKVELPRAAAATAAPVGRGGDPHQGRRYLFNQKPVAGDDELRELFRGALADNPETSLVVSADNAAMHGRVVHAIDLAKQAGITKFAISVQRE